MRLLIRELLGNPHLAPWEQLPRLVASLATARRPENRAQIAKNPYDLIVIDEAHHLKNRASVSWKFVNDLQRKYILLLTATPVENNLDELYNLLAKKASCVKIMG